MRSMDFSTMKISIKSAKALKKKKVYWGIRAGGADIAESWVRKADPVDLEVPKVHSLRECGVLHRVKALLPLVLSLSGLRQAVAASRCSGLATARAHKNSRRTCL